MSQLSQPRLGRYCAVFFVCTIYVLPGNGIQQDEGEGGKGKQLVGSWWTFQQNQIMDYFKNDLNCRPFQSKLLNNYLPLSAFYFGFNQDLFEELLGPLTEVVNGWSSLLKRRQIFKDVSTRRVCTIDCPGAFFCLCFCLLYPFVCLLFFLSCLFSFSSFLFCFLLIFTFSFTFFLFSLFFLLFSFSFFSQGNICPSRNLI